MMNLFANLLALGIYGTAIYVVLALFGAPFVALSKHMLLKVYDYPEQRVMNVVRVVVVVGMVAFYCIWMFSGIRLALNQIPFSTVVNNVQNLLTSIQLN